MCFVPIDQSQAVGATVVLRMSRGAADVLPAVKAAIWSQFPDLALPDSVPLSCYLERLTAPRRLNMLLLNMFGVLGITIACAGIYGVMAYATALRTREFGIRLALGAAPSAVLKTVLQRAMGYILLGLAVGLPLAWVASTLIGGFLFQVHPHDPMPYLTAAQLW